MKSVIHEHILVCLSSAPSSGNTIRNAAKMSQAFGGTLTALYVQTKHMDTMRERDKQQLQKHFRLAEKLGANISIIEGDDVAYQIAEFARLSKVSKIVIGKSNSSEKRFLGQKPLTEQLVELVPYLDVYIIPDINGENRKHSGNPTLEKEMIPSIQEMLITAIVLFTTTMIGFLFQNLHFTEANTITIYILGVLLTALFTKNYICSGITSFASVMLFNFFFTAPRLSFDAYESGYPITFAIMLFASLIIGTLANRIADHVKQASRTAWRTQVLLDTTRELQNVGDENEILQVVTNQLIKLLNRPLIIYPVKNGALERPLIYNFGQKEVTFEKEYEIAQWTFRNKKRAGATTDTFENSLNMYLSIHGNNISYGVVGISINGKPLEPLENSVMLSILGEGALALENYYNAKQKEETAVFAKNEQLRANLLRSISHDLRTPLTSISGNAENLLISDEAMSTVERKEVLTAIYNDSIWLIQLVENLLSLTKIEEGRARLKLTINE